MGFESVLKLEEGPGRTAAIAAWVQGLYPDEATAPVLVGGAAVELYTGGAYVTGDLDFVGEVPVSVRRRLKEAGFRKEGRHWLHEEGQIFLEFPSSSLMEGGEPARIRAGSGHVVVVRPEELLLDRLRCLVHWRYREDGANAFLLAWAQRRALSPTRVRRLASAPEERRAFESLWKIVRRAGGQRPSNALVDRWIEEVLR